jgi:hypothetical protein
LILDSAGQRLEVPIAIDGAALVFEVPAAYWAQAKYPVALDPIITTERSIDVDAPPPLGSHVTMSTTYQYGPWIAAWTTAESSPRVFAE